MEKADEFMRRRHEYFIEEIRDYLAVGEDSFRVACYPNPFEDEIHLLGWTDDVKAQEVVIYDVMGRKVFSETCFGETLLKPNLPAGVYVLKVGTFTQRIVKY